MQMSSCRVYRHSCCRSEWIKTADKMNKWKIAFFVCLTILLLVTAFGIYSIIDQGVSLAYMEQGYSDTENDLQSLTKLINETDLTKGQISKALSKHNLYESMDLKSDTISLYRINLIFKDDKLLE